MLAGAGTPLDRSRRLMNCACLRRRVCAGDQGGRPESTQHLRTRPDISEAARAKIGGRNAQRFYGLN